MPMPPNASLKMIPENTYKFNRVVLKYADRHRKQGMGKSSKYLLDEKRFLPT